MLERREHHTSQEELLPYSSPPNPHSGGSSIATSFDELAKGARKRHRLQGQGDQVGWWRPPGSRVGLHLGGIEEQLLAPHQPCLDALLDDPLEEAPEDLQAEPIPYASERGVLLERLLEVVAQVPAHREAI